MSALCWAMHKSIEMFHIGQKDATAQAFLDLSLSSKQI